MDSQTIWRSVNLFRSKDVKIMEWILSVVMSIFAASLSSMGMGGGGILLTYLTAYRDVPQFKAQGMNLVFFIPVAITALIFHQKHGLIEWKATAIAVVTGVLGVFLGFWLGQHLGELPVKKMFAVLVMIMGVKEIFSK